MSITLDCNDLGLFGPALSIFISVFATWLFAWLYYKQAGDELKREAERLRKAAHLILYCHTNPGAKVGAIYDKDGLISGLTVDMQARL